MKKTILTVLLVGLLGIAGAQAQTLGHGVNLTLWCQPATADQANFGQFQDQDLRDLQALGVDTVRLPVNFGGAVGPRPQYSVNRAFLAGVETAVDKLLAAGFTVVLDNHTYAGDPVFHQDPEGFLTALWRQLSAAFQAKSSQLVYEIQNEPFDIDAKRWDNLQHRLVEQIRRSEVHRTLVVTGADWGGIAGMLALGSYSDSGLIYTFHFYDPFLFTHQGAGWADLETLEGVRFPPQGPVPSPGKTSPGWVTGSLKDYYQSDAVDKLAGALDQAVQFSRSRNVPIWCGEWGVYSKRAIPSDRVEWYATVHRLLDERKIPWTIWDYRGAFGIFQPGSPERVDRDLNLSLVSALGFKAPQQATSPVGPIQQGFWIDRDGGPCEYRRENWLSSGFATTLADDHPLEGTTFLRWKNGGRYSHWSWKFDPAKDLSSVVDRGQLEISVRSDRPVSFVVRFLASTDESPAGLPWRIGTTISISQTGTWQTLSIPLTSLKNQGAWLDAWHDPVPDLLPWNHVREFQIVAEDHDLAGAQIDFDGIRVRVYESAP